MSGKSMFPTATTRPTEKRAGFGIDPHKANCPFCNTEGTVTMTIQLCHNCGRWFEAEPEEGDDEA